MESNLDTFRIVDAADVYKLNEAYKQGYELIKIFYEDYSIREWIQEKVPVTYAISTSTRVDSYGYSGPTHNVIEKEVITVQRTPRALMKLSPSAQVIYGKE